MADYTRSIADSIKQTSNSLSHSAAPNKAFDLTGKDALSGQ